ncbi:MAG: U32 family peptidase [Candidatus Omnitrophica bacterium]|nr:U32 family peptidase [Candidatus Omnitrophota bacterium]
MEFSIPTNWQKELLQGLKQVNATCQIKEVYGKLSLDDVGGGRTASALAFVSQEEAKEQIKDLHRNGYKFNYLLNAVCMGNMEFTRKGQRKIRKLLEWLIENKIDSVTLANPYLAMWVKDNFPNLSISVSAMANIDSPNRAKFWESLGVDKITLPGPVFNRNFTLIKLLRKSIKCKLQLIANNACLLNCPVHIDHALMNCHASQKWHPCKGYMFDYYLIMCRYRRLKEPINFIRSDWIRPEDIAFYEKLGIDSIKLVDRRLPTAMILKIIIAYLNRSYQGNLVDLFHTLQGKSFNAHKGWIKKIFYYSKSHIHTNLLKMFKASSLLSSMKVSIDNQKLDNFLKDYPENCDLNFCDRCGYCKKVTEQAVKIDEVYLKDTVKLFKKTIDSLF